jgi:hypothetical protein
MKILALGHRAQTGKDTLSGFMATEIRLTNKKVNVQVAGFADELKDFCYKMYSWAGLKRKEHYETHPEDKKLTLPAIGKTVRQLWIDVGNHMRQYDGDIWVRGLLTRPQVDILIVKDLRFPNEFEMVKKLGGHCVKVIREAVPVLTDDADTALADCTEWDLIVDNDGDKKELHRKAGMLIDTFNLGV